MVLTEVWSPYSLSYCNFATRDIQRRDVCDVNLQHLLVHKNGNSYSLSAVMPIFQPVVVFSVVRHNSLRVIQETIVKRNPLREPHCSLSEEWRRFWVRAVVR